MTRDELHTALQEFANKVLGSGHPQAKAGAVIDVRQTFAWPETKNDEPTEPVVNAQAMVRVQQHGPDAAEGEKWAAALREAIEADPLLDGRADPAVRVVPRREGQSRREIYVLAYVEPSDAG